MLLRFSPTQPAALCLHACYGRPVDTAVPVTHFHAVNKKPHKVGEPKAAYAGKKPAKGTAVSPQPRPLDDAAARRITDKIFTERKELLRKLAQ